MVTEAGGPLYPFRDVAEEGNQAVANERPGYFRENWRMLVALLLPLSVLLTGIVVLIIYETSYSFRKSWDAWWHDLFNPSTAVAVRAAPIVPNVATYSQEHVAACKAMPDNYILDTPEAANPIELRPSIGLAPDASSKDINERCVAFAKTVAKMRTMSEQRHHAYLCPGTRFSIGKGFGFEPDPAGGGILLTADDPAAEKIRVPLSPGSQTIYKQWQFYNLGDGCYVMGYSSRRARTMEVTER